MHGNKSRIEMSALVLSFFALLLSIFPPCIIERKMKILEQICRDETAAFSFELNSCGKDADCGCPSEAEQCAAQLKRLCLLLRIFAAAMMLIAGAAIATAVYAWTKEKNREFCLYSIVSASVALSWQHIGALPAVGLALFLFIALFFCWVRRSREIMSNKYAAEAQRTSVLFSLCRIFLPCAFAAEPI